MKHIEAKVSLDNLDNHFYYQCFRGSNQLSYARLMRDAPLASRCRAQALADGGGIGVGAAGATPKSVVTSLAGFASTGSAMVPSASGWASPEPTEGANSAPKSVVTPMAGLAGGGPASAPTAVADGGSLWLGLPTRVSISLTAVRRPQPLSNMRPAFPGGPSWLSECAAATIPAPQRDNLLFRLLVQDVAHIHAG